jgi:hypothetical protein
LLFSENKKVKLKNITFSYLETDKNEESSDSTSWLQGDGYPALGATSQTREHEPLEVY